MNELKEGQNKTMRQNGGVVAVKKKN